MQITINKKSWHYRWYKFLHDKTSNDLWNDPKSVCPYFWGFVMRNLFVLFLLILVTTLVFIVSSPIGLILAKLTSIDFADVYLKLGVVVSIIYVVTGVIFLCIFIEDKAKEYYMNVSYKIRHTEETSFIGVTKSYFKSFKDKVCPTIKYKEK